MNILLESRAFHPSVGGLETVSRQLAEAWQAGGHRVRVMTITPLRGEEELDGLPVVRRPSPKQQWCLARWGDVFVQSGVSLRSLWLPLAARRPLVIIHHNMLDGESGLTGALKPLATHLGRNVAVSDAVAATVPGPSVTIPNPFRSSMPAAEGAGERAGLLFVGRLVSVKGADLALDALARLHAQGEALSLTVCGDGPERAALERQAERRGLRAHVTFAGWATPQELAAHYARAEVTLVPSRYEPFGIVALEALSCGCPVVAARTGGLPEAVGPGGLLCAPGDAGDLARQIRRARTPAVRERLREAMPAHVAHHDIDHIAGRYLEVLEAAVAGE